MAYITLSEIMKMDDLETIFSKVYSAINIINFFKQFMQGAVDDPEVLQAVESNPILCRSGKMLKRHMAAALQVVFLDQKLAAAFYRQQTDTCREVLYILTWYGDKSLSILEQLLKKRIAKKNLGCRNYLEPFVLTSGLELLLLDVCQVYFYQNNVSKKDNIMVFLPRQIIEVFRKCLPKPAAYYLTPLKRKPETDFIYSGELSALNEIPRMIKFINLGGLTLKKNGQAAAKGLRDLRKISGSKEFYPDSDVSQLKLLKSSMLAAFLLAINRQGTESVTQPQDVIREIFYQWRQNNNFTFTGKFLNHLKVVSNRYYYHDDNHAANIKNNLLLLLKKLPATGWTSLLDIQTFTGLRRLNLMEFNLMNLEFRHYTESQYGHWDEWESVNSTNVNQVVCLPLLKSFFFLAAALGLVEIGYNYPTNLDFKRMNREYLSEYDGLQMVQLTKLGAYVADKTKKFSADIQKKAKYRLHLDTTRLLLIMEGSDPLTDLSLRKILEPIGTGRYMLTYASLLKNCRSKQDVKKKITLFKKIISQTVPRIWRDFFKSALGKINPLTVEPAVAVFKVEPNQELLRILTSDPEISALVLKVEGLRIAVELPDLSKLYRLLQAHGYLVSESRLLGTE